MADETKCPLNVVCPEKLEATREFAKKVGAAENFEEQLEILQRIGTNQGADEVIITSDFTEYGFGWAVMKNGESTFSGALLFCMPGSWGGGFPNLSVEVEPVEKPEWRIHS